MVLANITHICDLLDYAKQGWTDPAVLVWHMELPTLCAPCYLLQEVKAALSDTALAYID